VAFVKEEYDRDGTTVTQKGGNEPMKKKQWLLIAVLMTAALGLVVSGCGKPSEKGPQEILVGSVACITGMYAGMADGGVFGQQAAVEDINKEGGVFVKEYGRKIPIKLTVVNSESDPLKTGTLAESLILQDKVQFLTCHNEPPPMHAAVATMAARHKVPHLANVAVMEPWLHMREEASLPWDYTWALGFAIATPGPPGYSIIDTWKEELDKYGDKTNKKVGVFATDDPDGVGWYALFPKALKDWGYDVIGVDKKVGLFPMDTTDFTSIIQVWKNNKVEILWGNCPAPVFGALWRQARSMGFEPKIVTAGRAALYYTDIEAWGGDLPNGIGTETFWSPAIKTYAAIGDTTPMSLYERWQQEKKRPFNVAMGFGYQVIQVLVNAIERAGTLDADAVLKAIGETDMETIVSRVKFDQQTHFARVPVFLGQWQKTDTPEVWECPIVFSKHDFLPPTAEFLFPIPYK
jgi:ABC-type branched-subunit amino acid transport system substrate-binding protein